MGTQRLDKNREFFSAKRRIDLTFSKVREIRMGCPRTTLVLPQEEQQLAAEIALKAGGQVILAHVDEEVAMGIHGSKDLIHFMAAQDRA